MFGLRYALAALLLCPTVLHSQVDTTARLMGYARSAFNGRPLAGVMIAVPAARQFVVTDSTGTFELANVPSGRQRVRIAYEGRETEEYEFELRRGKTKRLAVLLDVSAVDLAPVVVEVQHRDWSRNLAGFYERRKWYNGFGRFYTREDLERVRAGTLSSLLARDGIFTRCMTHGCVPMKWSRGRLCALAVAVDGMPFWENSYDQIAVDDVQGVEVYRSDVLPGWGGLIARTRAFGLLEPRGVCGSVQIWTR